MSPAAPTLQTVREFWKDTATNPDPYAKLGARPKVTKLIMTPIKNTEYLPTETVESSRTAQSRTETGNAIDTFNQVRKWNINFDGKGDAVAFIERKQN